jgi:transcription antitermination factor NusG
MRKMLYNFDSFPGFAPEDFDAFQERKWGSNRFNLERMKARAKLDGLGRELETRLGEVASGLVFSTTLDHPHIFNKSKVCHLWLYLDRPSEERNQLARVIDKDTTLRQKVEDTIPQHHVALVGVGLDHEYATIFFRLHANALLDRKNLISRLGDPSEINHLAILLSRLDEDFQMHVDGELNPLPTAASEVESLRTRLDKLNGWFGIELRLPRDDDALASPDLVDRIAEAMPGLLDIWRFAAWSRENDRLKLSRVLKEEKKQKAKKLSGFEDGDQVRVTSGLLSGKEGKVLSVDLKGRVKVQFGRLNMEMEAKLLKRI